MSYKDPFVGLWSVSTAPYRGTGSPGRVVAFATGSHVGYRYIAKTGEARVGPDDRWREWVYSYADSELRREVAAAVGDEEQFLLFPLREAFRLIREESPPCMPVTMFQRQLVFQIPLPIIKEASLREGGIRKSVALPKIGSISDAAKVLSAEVRLNESTLAFELIVRTQHGKSMRDVIRGAENEDLLEIIENLKIPLLPSSHAKAYFVKVFHKAREFENGVQESLQRDALAMVEALTKEGLVDLGFLPHELRPYISFASSSSMPMAAPVQLDLDERGLELLAEHAASELSSKLRYTNKADEDSHATPSSETAGDRDREEHFLVREMSAHHPQAQCNTANATLFMFLSAFASDPERAGLRLLTLMDVALEDDASFRTHPNSDGPGHVVVTTAHAQIYDATPYKYVKGETKVPLPPGSKPGAGFPELRRAKDLPTHFYEDETRSSHAGGRWHQHGGRWHHHRVEDGRLWPFLAPEEEDMWKKRLPPYLWEDLQVREQLRLGSSRGFQSQTV